MKIYCLREIYELRKTKPLQHRVVVARYFEVLGVPGLVDSSATLWPISNDILPRKICAVGDVLKCELEAYHPENCSSSKYEDEGYFIRIRAICDQTPSLGPWPNQLIPSPVPDASLFPATVPQQTSLFPSPGKKRLATIETRNLGISRTRDFFENRGFVSMETPTLVPSGGVETYLHSFTTEYKDHRGDIWPLALPTSPEFALKKILTEGPQKIFQISRSFRNNGELAKWHEPEFLMLEWYRTGANLEDMQEDTKSLVMHLAKNLCASREPRGEWQSFRIPDLFEKLAGISLEKVQDTKDFRDQAKNISGSIVDTDDWDSVFFKVFFEKIEPFLSTIDACFVTAYPHQMAALARLENNGIFSERFECYLFGVEICNGYHELTDSHELSARFEAIEKQRPEAARDLIFEKTMKYGLPPCSGNALGLDRVIALLAGEKRISDIFAIPFLSQFPRHTIAPE